MQSEVSCTIIGANAVSSCINCHLVLECKCVCIQAYSLCHIQFMIKVTVLVNACTQTYLSQMTADAKLAVGIYRRCDSR